MNKYFWNCFSKLNCSQSSFPITPLYFLQNHTFSNQLSSCHILIDWFVFVFKQKCPLRFWGVFLFSFIGSFFVFLFCFLFCFSCQPCLRLLVLSFFHIWLMHLCFVASYCAVWFITMCSRLLFFSFMAFSSSSSCCICSTLYICCMEFIS